MRERLVAAFVGLTVLVVALYGIPRAYFLADLVRDQEHERVERTADLVARIAEMPATPFTPALLDDLTGDAERISVRWTDGTVVSSTDGPAPADGDVSASADLADGAVVTVTRGADAVDDEIAEALLPLLLIGLGLVLLAGAAGFVIARRLARPFSELADAAAGLGTGRLHPELPSYRVPEAQAIGEALQDSGHRIDDLLRHEREMAVHASHELRTPVTALRLELEDLALWPETPETVAAELGRMTGELDRLTAAIADLLTRTRDQVAVNAMDVDLDALLADAVARLEERGMPVTHTPTSPLPTRTDPRAVSRVLELLATAAGPLVVTAADVDSHHEVLLAGDGGLGLPETDTRWTEAVELVTALGGHLTRRTRSEVVVRLPKREPLGVG